jgi:glycosyltransferase involved in cell wall biosynthesis
MFWNWHVSIMSLVSTPDYPVALTATVIQRGRSGVASYLFSLLDALHRIAPDLQLHVFGLEDDRPLFARWLDGMTWHPVPARCRNAVMDLAWHQMVLPGHLRRIGAGCLHIPSYRRIVAAAPCRQVVTIHDLAPLRLDKKYDPLRMFYGRQIVPRLARRADAILAVSGTTAADVEEFCDVHPPVLRVVLNGIEHDRFSPAPAHEIEREQLRILGSKTPYFLYVARWEHPAKNHVRLIEAFELFCRNHPERNHTLVLGGADWHGAEIIRARLAASPVKDRIRSLGFVNDTDLPWLYRGATALVFPSLFEGFGLPPIEAMACGCPVLTSPNGSLREIVGSAARLMDPLSPEDMCRALEEIASSETQRDALRAAGLRQATLYHWDTCARAVVESYWQPAGLIP